MITRMRKRILRKTNNRGAALVFVLFAFTIMTILVTLVLMASLLNVKMKSIDANAKNSFYSCESIMNEVKAGLQNEVSNAYKAAYLKVMQNFTLVTSDEVRQKNFKAAYIETLHTVLMNGVDNKHYDINKLHGYLNAEEQANNKIEITTVSEDASTNLLTTVDDGLALKNLIVRYTDNKGNMSEIQTDIVLEYPSIDFTQTSAVPDLLSFALVAQDTLQCDTASQSVITGNLYGGKEVNGINVLGNLTLKKATLAVTDSAVNVARGASFFNDDSTNLWTNAINVVSSEISLKGATYLSDDLTIKDDKGSQSKISISGNYFGYGKPDTALSAAQLRLPSEEYDALKTVIKNNNESYSSAIIVNGTNVSMDLSNLSYLMLSGNAYVNTKQQDNVVIKNQNILMGESLTVKSNQLVYLVPAEWIGTSYAHGMRNPMTSDDYSALLSEAGLSSTSDLSPLVDSKNLSANNAGFTVAFYQAPGGTLVYFYLTFTSEKNASDYYNKYYQANSDQLSKYVHFYVNEIKTPNDSSIKFDLNGYILRSVTEDDVTTNSYTTDTTGTNNSVTLIDRQISLQNKFYAYCHKLIPGYLNLTSTEKSSTVFENLINKSELENDLSGKNYLSYETTSSHMYGLLTEKDVFVQGGKSPSSEPIVINEADGSLTVYTGDATAEYPALRVIITTGNVTLQDCNYQGLIVSDKKVELMGAVSITAMPDDVAKVLETKREDTDKPEKMKDILKDKDSYDFSGATSGAASSVESTDVTDLVIYRNWVKQ